MRKSILIPSVSLVIVTFITAFSASQQANLQPALMRQKLHYAQAVLEALVSEDFEAIEDHALWLLQLSEASAWNGMNSPEYAAHNSAFRHAVDSLKEGAHEKTLDGTALAYVELTLVCVQCHKDVRRAGRADLQKTLVPTLGTSPIGVKTRGLERQSTPLAGPNSSSP